MEDLTNWVIERIAKMAREHRFTLGDRLIETCLDTTTLLYEAAYTREKLPLLARASRGLMRARLLVRLAQRQKVLSIDQREYFTIQSTEIGQMIGGWTKSVRARYETPRRPPG